MGQLFIVTGFPSSATGKTTIVSSIVDRMNMRKENSAKRIVTFTTRTKRPSEKDGVDYQFCSKREFRKLVNDGEFLEYDDHFDAWYGTRRKDVEEALRDFDAVFIVTDLSGMHTLRLRVSDAKFFAIVANEADVVSFMRIRGESEKKIAMRLSSVSKQKEVFDNIKFDAVVRNEFGKLDEASTLFAELVMR